jgi:hypothetical protein
MAMHELSHASNFAYHVGGGMQNILVDLDLPQGARVMSKTLFSDYIIVRDVNARVGMPRKFGQGYIAASWTTNCCEMVMYIQIWAGFEGHA